MLIAILILTIVNISLTLIAIAGIDIFKTDVQKSVAAAARHTDESIENATTALSKMDSIKQRERNESK